jgi:hypothetical protein
MTPDSAAPSFGGCFCQVRENVIFGKICEGISAAIQIIKPLLTLIYGCFSI